MGDHIFSSPYEAYVYYMNGNEISASQYEGYSGQEQDLVEIEKVRIDFYNGVSFGYRIPQDEEEATYMGIYF